MNMVGKYLETVLSKSDQVFKVLIQKDKADDDFIRQAVNAGISPQQAVKTRYTTLLKNKVGDTPIEIDFDGKKILIERPRYSEVIRKLEKAGLHNAVNNGLELTSYDCKYFLDRGGWLVNNKINKFQNNNYSPKQADMSGFDSWIKQQA